MIMKPLKKIAPYGLVVLGLLFGLIVSATAETTTTQSNFERTKAHAEQGSALDQAILGGLYSYGVGVRQNNEKAFYWFQQSANQGHNGGQSGLGFAYYLGKGASQDYAKALQWFSKSADQNDIASQVMIGSIYENGNGVKQNKTTAKEWYGKACDNGYQDGCDSYRKLNEQGY